MSSAPPSLFPYAGDNAIQNAVFALEWSEPLNSAELQRIAAMADDVEFKRTFPQVLQPQALVVNVSPEVSGQQVQQRSAEIAGVHFNRPSLLNLGVPAKAFHISRRNCLAIISEYTRWKKVWPEVMSWFTKAVPHLAGRAFTAVGLQYTDLFHWKDDPTKLVLSEVVSRSSSYITPHAFTASSLWHSHFGFMQSRGEPVPHELLENVNINLIENSGQRSLQIVTSHKATLQSPLWGDRVVHNMESLLPDLHERNKVILRDLLMPAVRERIKLK